ncbi:hypothetical protein AB0D13_39755 [Streptomyces sp. NPDC048430]|uniref:hypothetical protein n=1 Tax=Streptomyces sp. NPDC048430 TaxID=3155388 RepID=UPI003434AB41
MFQPLYVIGIDCGTSGAGFAGFAVDQVNDDPRQRRFECCDQWPGQPVASLKNLSALLVTAEGEVLSWGHAARHRALNQTGGPDAPRYYAGFKMQLMEQPIVQGAEGEHTGEQRAVGAEEGGEEVRTCGMSVLERPLRWVERSSQQQAELLTVELLKRVREKALTQIAASGYLEEDVRYCLTVPAIFGDSDNQRVRRLAIKAGFPAEDGRLVLAREPEAAVHSARLHSVRVPGGDDSSAGSLTDPGRRIVVLDGGGGTVDFAAYKNDTEGYLVEIGLVNGARLGSNELNARFEDRLLVDRFGKPELIERLKQEAPEAMLEMAEAWERGKLDFGPDTDTPIKVGLPTAVNRRLGAAVRKRVGRKQRGVTDAIIVTPEEVRDLFDTVVPEILELLDEQLAEVKDGDGAQPVVLMVGGFSNSAYLQHAVKEHLAGRALVLVPPEPGNAVLYGAAHYAYAPQTRARRARFTYGIAVCSDFVPGVDPEEARRVTRKGRVYCATRFGKIVTRGDIVDTAKEIGESYTPIEGHLERMEIALHTSTEDDPRYVTDPGCRRVGTIKVDLRDVMDIHLEDRHVDVRLSFGETEIKVRAIVRSTGQEAACTVDFASDY